MTHRYETGDATYIIKPTGLIFDGIFKLKFICKIHPVNGPVVEMHIPAFYAFDAFNKCKTYYKDLTK